MTWTKLSDTFLDDPLLTTFPRGTRLLYVELLIWCNRHGTDGHLPSHIPARVSDEPDAQRAIGALVEAGLLVTKPDGWLIVDFLITQRSHEETERERAASRERQERYRRHVSGDHSKCDRCSAIRNGVSNGVTNGVTNGPPTRPDPT